MFDLTYQTTISYLQWACQQ